MRQRLKLLLGLVLGWAVLLMSSLLLTLPLPPLLRSLCIRWSPLVPLPGLTLPSLLALYLSPLESKLQALDLLSSYLDAPLVEALRAKLSPPEPAPVTPTIASHRALAQELADKCKMQEKLQAQLDQQKVKVAEVERNLERMQEELVVLVGRASDLDEEILELRRKVSIVPEPEEMEESSGSTPRALPRKRAKARILRTKKGQGFY